MDVNWSDKETAGKKCYVLAGRGRRRERFLEFLEMNGYECENDEITSRESVIESIFPISVDIENKCYGHLHNKTCAAAAISAGDAFTVSQFYKFIELISTYIIV